MKTLIIIILFVIGAQSFAAPYSKMLAWEDVSHLELVVNNLNMIILSKSEEISNKESISGVENKYIKFYLTKDDRLAVNSMHVASVAMVTQAKCQEILIEGLEKIRSENSPIPNLITAVSLHKFKIGDAKKFVSNAYIKVFLQAKENSELVVSCEK